MSAFITAKEIRAVGFEVPSIIEDNAIAFRYRFRPIYARFTSSGDVFFDVEFYRPDKSVRTQIPPLRMPRGPDISRAIWDLPDTSATPEEVKLATQLGLFEP